MNSKYLAYTILVPAAFCLIIFSLLQPATVIASTDAPLAARCPGIGPLADEAEYCGCTWGEVYYQGEPIIDAEVSLTFDGQTISTKTFVGIEGEAPYFDMTGAELGAKRGDIMTLTVQYAGQTIEQPFRAIPGADDEQHIPIVLPDTIRAESIGDAGYGRAVAADGSHLWAGGPSGLQRFDLDGANPQDIALPWTDPSISLLEAGANNTLWAVGSGGLAQYDGNTWTTENAAMTGTIRALAYDAANSRLWAGGGTDQAGHLLQKNDGGAWETVESFDETVTSLHVDNEGGIWLGTWGDGAFYRATPTAEWVQYTAADGLASDFLYDMTGSSDGAAGDVWFGTRPYLTGAGNLGGLGRYQATSEVWSIYTTTHGLVADDALLGAVENIYSVVVTEAGSSVWIGTDQGIQRQIQPGLWAAVGPELSRIYHMVALPEGVAVAHAGGITLYHQGDVRAALPAVSMLQAQGGNTVLNSGTLRLSATAQADETTENSIVGWSWTSDLAGPLCTTAGECAYSATDLQLGEHTISLRVQDRLGNWSTEATTTVTVAERLYTYLPSMLGGGATR